MRAGFNTTIDVKSATEGDRDSNNNKTFTYSTLLDDIAARSAVIVRNKLTDQREWIQYKIRTFMIQDIDTDLTNARYVVYDGKNYKIERIYEPEGMARATYRNIKTEYKEVDM